MLIWGFVALAVWAVSNRWISAQGRRCARVKDAPLMAETFGVDTVQEKRIAFVLAALLAGLSAGCMPICCGS